MWRARPKRCTNPLQLPARGFLPSHRFGRFGGFAEHVRDAVGIVSHRY
jgi:hypothetical protein